MNQKVQDAINAQIADEFYASYLYLSMMAYFEAESLGGYAQWMRMQAEEEHAHLPTSRRSPRASTTCTSWPSRSVITLPR